MIHPLVRKELREHLWVLIAMWVITALGLAVLLASARMDGSPLAAYQRLVAVFGALLSLALANRLVVREYGGGTQLFLETLPMGRGQVIGVKWLIGAACLLLPMALAFALVLRIAASSVELTSGFVLILALRSGVFLLFAYSMAFFVGLTGRYRYLLWLAFVILALIANIFGQMPPGEWPPFQLVSDSMAYEREVMPVRSLWITGLATVLLVGAAFALAMGFQGSWVVAMARRMSLREKVVMTAAFVSVIYVVTLLEDRKPKPAFTLQDAVTSDSGPPVMVARAEGVSDAAALGLARRVASELQELQAYLGLRVMPVVAVLPDVSIDSDLFMVAALPDSDGVVLRGAFGSTRFDEPGFRAFTVMQVLDWHSRGRAALEMHRWLLDGFSRWQVAQDDVTQHELLTLRAAVALDAAEEGGVALAVAFRQWLGTRERLGDCLSEALAWRATDFLAASLGPEKFREFARAILGLRPPSDIRAWLARTSMDEQLQRVGAPTLDALTRQLQDAMRIERAALSDRMQGLRPWPVSFSAEPMRGSVYELRYAVGNSNAETPPPFAVRYARLGPWDLEVAREGLERMDATASGVLPTSFTRGEHVFTAVEMHSPQLACTVRLGARRWVLQ